jgi:diguanylate cyclase (GGDEF)-like protein/PAS domain S-box-containing protein
MIESYNFLRLVIDTIAEHIVVIDDEGTILFVNKAWEAFGHRNSCLIDEPWNTVNYIKVCDQAAAMGDDFGTKAARGIRSVINGEKDNFYFEYPCHSPDDKRWFMMRVTPFMIEDNNYCVISHQNITERKLAEEKVLNLSRIDSLTDIPNRRCFDNFLNTEWKRCNRQGLPISLALIDLDHFKLINDTYGHQAGDRCLKLVGDVLKEFSKRPSDICARYGGEEFVIVYGNTDLEEAKVLVEKALNKIRLLNIPNENSPTLPTLTVSVGLATMRPREHNNQSDLIKESDKSLYSAKNNGRNQIHFSSDNHVK